MLKTLKLNFSRYLKMFLSFSLAHENNFVEFMKWKKHELLFLFQQMKVSVGKTNWGNADADFYDWKFWKNFKNIK